MAKQVIDPRIHRDDGVEHAGLRIGVKLDQDGRLTWCLHELMMATRDRSEARKPLRRFRSGPGRSPLAIETPTPLRLCAPKDARPYLANGCSTLSFCAVISSIFGELFMARSMASLVAS